MRRELRTCDMCGNEWADGKGYVLRRAVRESHRTIDLCSLGCLEQWAAKLRGEAAAYWQRFTENVEAPNANDVTTRETAT